MKVELTLSMNSGWLIMFRAGFEMGSAGLGPGGPGEAVPPCPPPLRWWGDGGGVAGARCAGALEAWAQPDVARRFHL